MSAGTEHCKFTNGGQSFSCNHCPTVGGPYKNKTITNRMASNHIVKKHCDIAKPANQMPQGEKRPYTPRKQKAAAGVRFCPVCGTSIHAINVALSL